jgi:S1-C subfamily serine protease
MNRLACECLMGLAFLGAGSAAGQTPRHPADLADRFRHMVTPDQNLISRLGILGLELTPELSRMIPGIRNPQGVVVAGVALDAEGSSGPLPGDVIYGVNGVPVRTLADLRGAIGQIASDTTAVLQVGRQGQLRFLTVTLQ